MFPENSLRPLYKYTKKDVIDALRDIDKNISDQSMIEY